MKQAWIGIVVVLVALAGVIGWQLGKPSDEPVYKGRALSKWLKAYAEDMATDHYSLTLESATEADEAVRQAGTNAIPTLLRMLSRSDSPSKPKWLELAQRQHLIEIRFAPDNYWNVAAADGFRVLGEKGHSAVPALIEIVNRNISEASRNGAILALGHIGPAAKQAVPELMLWATNVHAGVRGNAIMALGRIHAEPDRVVPLLVKSLHDPDENVRWCATYALKGIDPEAGVPDLLKLAGEGESASSLKSAITSLGMIGPPAREAIPSLQRWATNGNAEVRALAGRSLRRN